MEIRFTRRDLLATTAFLTPVALGGLVARANVMAGARPWRPDAGAPPKPAAPGGWIFFTEAEGKTAEAIADRIIPPDPQTPGGKDAGCAVFLDRQLAGGYGRGDGLYVRPPFMKGTNQQGPQHEGGPGRQYREGLAALDSYCRSNHNAAFAMLDDAVKDTVLKGLESGEVKLEGVDGRAFFELVLKDVQEGFFADPLYGGNRDMAAWRMIGYPGARYDYRDWVGRHNERYPLPPVSIMGRADWTPREAG
jgi:gluconate 2-dehydrogenase gamma chain